MTVQNIFLWTSLLILALTAVSKLIAVHFYENSLFLSRDVVLPFIRVKELLIAVSVYELGLAYCLYSRCKAPVHLLSILFITSVCFASYRIGIHFSGMPVPCQCLGGLLGFIPGGNEVAQIFSFGSLVFLGSGSFILLIYNLLGNLKP